MSLKARHLTFFLLCFLIGISASFIFYEPRDDFHYANPNWNGFSSLVGEFDARIVGVDIDHNSLLSNSSHYALIIVPMVEPSSDYLTFLKTFVASGGLLIIADDKGYGNMILESFGLDARFDHEGVLYDPVFFWKKAELAYVFADVDGEKVEVLTNYASIINCKNCSPLLVSSRLSFFDADLDGVWEKGEIEGPHVIAASTEYENGCIVLVADPDIFTNFSIQESKSLEFVRRVIGGRLLVLDESLNRHSSYAVLRMNFLSFLAALYRWREVFIITLSFISLLLLVYIVKWWKK